MMTLTTQNINHLAYVAILSCNNVAVCCPCCYVHIILLLPLYYNLMYNATWQQRYTIWLCNSLHNGLESLCNWWNIMWQKISCKQCINPSRKYYLGFIAFGKLCKFAGNCCLFSWWRDEMYSIQQANGACCQTRKEKGCEDICFLFSLSNMTWCSASVCVMTYIHAQPTGLHSVISFVLLI